MKKRPKPVKLLTGGNPQIAKAGGDAPVQAYIAAIPPALGEAQVSPKNGKMARQSI